MDASFRNTMILGVFVYGGLGLLALVVAAAMLGDRTAMLLGLGAFAASYGSQHAGAEGWRGVNVALMALALVLAAVAFVLLALH